ncbi:cytochrome c oxidase subunit I [Parablastomonas sp. CN1-191]|uniref:cytochrome c oxidase subunit I n=1 Tax=Parablastomonas sp. CN1-191 TaxID=3400908 RepID=UPI003BF86258
MSGPGRVAAPEGPLPATDTRIARTPRIAFADDALRERLQKIWESKPGLYGWFATVDHKEIGKRYIVTAFIMLALGGLGALHMRLQLAAPNLHVMSAQKYNELFSIHGMTMIFLYAGPVLSGFSNYFFPLWLGARDMAFPRMNALSYWIYLAAAAFLYAGPLLGVGPNDGWFNYAPYSERAFNPGINQDLYALGMVFLGISTSVGSANFLVTAARCRAPGMSINRLPIMVWGTLTASAANLVVIPAVSLAFFMLWLDRNFGTSFFTATGGGQPLLWQHLFWLFGHPWVYAIVLPAMGMASDGLPTFTRTPLVGYTLVALSTVATMLLGFGVWVHHMFATGLPGLGLAFFSGASIVITVPSAIAVFAWLSTIWLGRPVYTTAFKFFASMILLFVIGGVSGFMTASVPADWQLTDTYFVVAHIHYVLIGINVFPVCGATYMWFPKMTGRLMDERLGRWNFWTMFIGFNGAFLPMHLTGLRGMPRRIYTYDASMGVSTLNMITTVFSFVFAVGVLMFFWNVWKSRRSGESAGADPWGGPTLEWSTPSPPPPYNFAVIPTVATRHPLWEDMLDESEFRSALDEGMTLEDGKEALAVSILDGEPDRILKMPEDTMAPFWLTAAVTLLFVGLLFHGWWLVGLAGLGAALALLAWNLPRLKLLEREPARRESERG